MGFPLTLALRYMRSRKRAFISVSTVFAIVGVALGTAALATVAQRAFYRLVRPSRRRGCHIA